MTRFARLRLTETVCHRLSQTLSCLSHFIEVLAVFFWFVCFVYFVVRFVLSLCTRESRKHETHERREHETNPARANTSTHSRDVSSFEEFPRHLERTRGMRNSDSIVVRWAAGRRGRRDPGVRRIVRSGSRSDACRSCCRRSPSGVPCRMACRTMATLFPN